MGHIFRWAATVMVIFATLLLTVRAVGGLNGPPRAMMSNAGECAQPCWYGIRPGTTTLDQAQAILHSVADFTVNPASTYFDNERCWNLLLPADPVWLICAVYRYTGDNVISLVRITPPEGALRLGDAVALFGSPLASTLCGWNSNVNNMPPRFLRARLYFRDNVEVWAYSRQRPFTFAYDPEMLVYLVSYYLPSAEALYLPGTPAWQGFVWLKHRSDC